MSSPRAGRRRRRDDDELQTEAKEDDESDTTNAKPPAAAVAITSEKASHRRPPKPNHQRCKEFRERRKHHISEMDERVASLRKEVSELIMKKSIYSSKAMLKRHHPHGSLEKLVREYFTLFSHGVSVERALVAPGDASPPSPPPLPTKAQLQWEFLQRVIDPASIYGDHRGPAGAIAQWGYYTSAYASFVGEVNRVNISGSEEDPILYCYTTYHVIVSRTTIKYLFPHVLHNEGLVQRMIGLYMPCSVVGIYRFSMDGRIVSEMADIELAEALLSAGCRVEDVEEMVQGLVISEEGMVPDKLQTEDYKLMEQIGIELDDLTAEVAEAKEKLRISFLLAEGNGEEEEEEEEEEHKTEATTN